MLTMALGFFVVAAFGIGVIWFSSWQKPTKVYRIGSEQIGLYWYRKQ